MNIRFEYLYRDYGNYKKWGEIVFSNPKDLGVDEVLLKARKVLIDQSYFRATEANVPDLHFEQYIGEIDHSWHEFYSFQLTSAAPNDIYDRCIDEFIDSLKEASVT